MRVYAPAHVPRHACADVDSANSTASNFAHFCHGFAAVASMAKGLEIASIRKNLPVAAMWSDVVNIRRPDPEQVRQVLLLRLGCTLPAEGFLQQLVRAEIIGPDRQAIPAVPIGGIGTPALSVSGLVLLAVACSRQLPAPGMSARLQGLQGQVITSWVKTKDGQG